MMIQTTVPSALGLFFTPRVRPGADPCGRHYHSLNPRPVLLLRRNALTGLRLSFFALLYATFVAGLIFY